MGRGFPRFLSPRYAAADEIRRHRFPAHHGADENPHQRRTQYFRLYGQHRQRRDQCDLRSDLRRVYAGGERKASPQCQPLYGLLPFRKRQPPPALCGPRHRGNAEPLSGRPVPRRPLFGGAFLYRSLRHADALCIGHRRYAGTDQHHPRGGALDRRDSLRRDHLCDQPL